MLSISVAPDFHCKCVFMLLRQLPLLYDTLRPTKQRNFFRAMHVYTKSKPNPKTRMSVFQIFSFFKKNQEYHTVRFIKN